MRFMMLMIPKGYESAEPDVKLDPARVAEMMKYNEELQKAGVLLALDGLHPPSMGARVSFAGGKPLESAPVKAAIEDARSRLGDKGRLVIRPSGTEPLIRVMAEADDPALVEAVVNEIIGVIGEAKTAA